MQYRIISWNVNGIRACEKKGLFDWVKNDSADIYCFQETKAHKEQLSDSLIKPPGYTTYWCSGHRKGYSGVAVWSKQEPLDVVYGFGSPHFDGEGRTIIAEFADFFLFNIYFPNGQKDEERLQFKLDFYAEFLKAVAQVQKQGKPVIVCGDVNTAHKEIDLARPKENSTVSGFLPIEREWLDKFIDAGLIDTLREFNTEAGQYTWWDVKTRARERNVGWRIDYFYVDKKARPYVRDAFILPDVYGSDHCPVGITLEI